MSLIIRDMTKVYKTKRGVFNIDFQVEAGEVYGLLGPNGAGKTTILKLVAGLLNKNHGSTIIDEVTMEDHPIEYKRSLVGMIGDTVLYEYLTPMEHLELMKLHNPLIDEKQMYKVLEEMDLHNYKDERVKQFSTGMKQRLAFAMCLVVKPKVLLLDEPFSGLDIEGKVLIRNKLQALKQEKEVAVVISSHLIHDVEEIATHVGIIKQGRLVEQEKVEVLLNKHKNLEDYFMSRTLTLKEGA